MSICRRMTDDRLGEVDQDFEDGAGRKFAAAVGVEGEDGPDALERRRSLERRGRLGTALRRNGANVQTREEEEFTTEDTEGTERRITRLSRETFFGGSH